MLTADLLARCTGASLGRAAGRVTAYNQALDAYQFNTRLRIAFLLANVGHESGGFEYTREIWNPQQVPAQARYEGRADLGNTQPGDGHKYRGAGDIERTGRKNFALARDRLRAKFAALNVPDFEADPDSLADPKWSALSACDFIDMVGANQYADAMNFDGYCDEINRGHATLVPGDSNGFANRLKLALIGLRELP